MVAAGPVCKTVGLAFVLTATVPVAAADHAPLSIAAIVTGKSLQVPATGVALAVSRRGEIAYTTQHQEESAAGDENHMKTESVWLHEPGRARALRKVCCDSGNASNAQWSPDGKRLAYVRFPEGESPEYSLRAELVVWNRAEARESVATRRLAFVQRLPAFNWLRNDALVGRLAVNEASAPPNAESSETPARGDPPARPIVYTSPDAAAIGTALNSFEDVERQYHCALSIINVSSLRSIRIAEGAIADFAASRTSDRIAYARVTGYQTEGLGNPIEDLVVYDVRSGVRRVVRTGSNALRSSAALHWSPDGGTLAFAELGPADRLGQSYAPVHVHYAAWSFARESLKTYPAMLAGDDPDAGRPVWLDENTFLAGLGNRIGVFRESLRQIEAHPDALVAYAGKGFAVVRTDDGLGSRILSIDARARVVEVSRVPFGFVGNTLTRTRDGFVLAAEKPDAPVSLYAVRSDFKSWRRVRAIEPALERQSYGSTFVLKWNGGAGIVSLPVGYDVARRYAVIVKVYPNIDAVNESGCFGGECGRLAGIWNTQLFQTRGYVVFTPNIPASHDNRLKDMAAAFDAGVQALIGHGIADPRRIGVFGQSQGGYTALALAVQFPSLAAVVALSSYSNYIDFDPLNRFAKIAEYQDMGTSLWNDPQRFIRNSPIFLLDKVQAPILLLQGGSDRATKLRQAEATFGALKRLGKTAELVVYPYEGHSQPYYTAHNQYDLFDRILAWYDKYLGAAPGRDQTSW